MAFQRSASASGAQLLASALGWEVAPGTREIGWHEVVPAPDFPAIDGFGHSFEAFHWHGDTYTLPEGGLKLFSSEACPEQGFLFEQNLALQFHLEIDIDGINELLQACDGDLARSSDESFVQSESQVREGGDFETMRLRRDRPYLDGELGGVAIEMEGAAAAAAATLSETPFLLARVVSDRADGGAKMDFTKSIAGASAKLANFVEYLVSSISS